MAQIILFGECMLELTGDGPTYHKSFAGDTYNTAVYLKRCSQKADVCYLTSVGKEPLSTELLTEMEKEQINTSLVQRSDDRHLGLYLVHTALSGERFFSYYRKDSAATQTFNKLTKKIPTPEMFYFSGISIAILDDPQRDALFKLIGSLKTKGTRIVFDTNYRPTLWSDEARARQWTDTAYKAADLVFAGLEDHQLLYHHNSILDVSAYMNDFTISRLVIKNGPGSVTVVANNKSLDVPITAVPSAEVVDTTAAGDSFNGAFIAAEMAGHSLTDTVLFAAQVASKVIKHKGAIVEREIFANWLKESG